MTGLSTIKLIPSTQRELDKLYLMIKNEILSGNENPLNIEVHLKAMEELIKKLRADNDIKDQMISEGYKYPEKSFEVFGAKFTKTVFGVKYDFSVCNDSEHKLLSDNVIYAKTKLKEKETFLKALKRDIAMPDTGEIVSPPIKTSKESMSVKLL